MSVEFCGELGVDELGYEVGFMETFRALNVEDFIPSDGEGVKEFEEFQDGCRGVSSTRDGILDDEGIVHAKIQ